MDRENVARRRLRRGVRTRGGRGRGVLQRSAVRRSHAIDEINVVDIETMPRGQPQESPLRKKRRRGWSSRPSSLYIASPTSSPAIEVSEVDGMGGVSEVDPPPHSALTPGINPATSTTPTPSIEVCPQLQQQSQDDEIDFIQDYGSEPDMTDESDSEELVPLIPKSVCSLMETPLDEVATPPTASDWPTTAPEDPTTSTATTSASYETPLGPSFYDFQWKSFPDPYIPPESRRETFSNSNVGPAAPCVDPYDIFINIWDRQIMEHITSETNRYAQDVAQKLLNTNNLHPRSRIASWRDTTVDELYAYFAILLAMAMVVKSKIEEYWSSTPDIFYTPGFSAHMSLKRFQLLSRCLHFANNEDMYASKLDVNEAKLFKIKPVVEHLNKKFQEWYNLGQNISLDESLLLWKGCLNINQLIPNKAASVGIKTYEVCESQTGYVWRFVVHSHRSQQQSRAQAQDPLEAFTSAIVLRLIQGLENKGHTLWMDNFYNSPALARKLKTLGFDCVGTLRTNRQFVPEALSQLTKENMYPGQIAGLTSGDVDVMVWRDQNRVGMISTYHGNAVAAREGSTKPTLILDYNIMMGGVDKKDQMLSMYPVERKRTKIWYKKFFRRLLNVSVLNAYIICKHSSSSVDHRSFRMTLIKSILSKHSSPTTTEPIRMRESIFEVKHHHLAEYPVANIKTNRTRRRCEVCKKRTYTFCVGCKKTFCANPCFVSSHL